MQIARKSTIPRIISGIAITTSLVAVLWIFLSSFWFWASLETAAALLVAVGCGGEWWLHHHPAGRAKKAKDQYHLIESRFIAMVSIGVVMEFFVAGHQIREGAQLEQTNLAMTTNLADLNNKTLELAHKYDESTNALAEAKARLATVRPLKERLIALMNDIDPSIIPELTSYQTDSMQVKGQVLSADISSLKAMSLEPMAEKYLTSLKISGDMFWGGQTGTRSSVEFTLHKQLIK